MFAVIWRDAALNQLADAWVLADPAARDAIERAVTRLNAALAADPVNLGESRSGGRRVAFEAPCGINFVPNYPLAQVVHVTHFWTY